jgi:hypothetical protein
MTASSFGADTASLFGQKRSVETLKQTTYWDGLSHIPPTKWERASKNGKDREINGSWINHVKVPWRTGINLLSKLWLLSEEPVE